MKKTVKVVAAIIQNENLEYLCALRPLNKLLGNMWEFPGGKVEVDEDLFFALKRELKEELNIEVQGINIFSDTKYEYDFSIVNLICINAKIISGEIKLLEHQNIVWLKKEALKSLVWAPADIEVIEKLIKGE